ncbi:MAG: hypothetical protein LWY06_00240 [Firmicutes bacterium]|nr:hypothetical protein [Bacillota bacterium]
MYKQPDNKAAMVNFVTAREPNEHAFDFMIPEGWIIEGGIFRVNPNMSGGFGQAIEAKIDMTVKMSAAGKVMFRLLPTYMYFDTRMSPTVAFMFPPGSNYGGMIVMQKPGIKDFLWQMLARQLHPEATNMKFIGALDLPDMAARKMDEKMRMGIRAVYETAIIKYEYTEGGVNYTERAFTHLADLSPMGQTIWNNEDTHIIRTPSPIYDQWEPVFDKMSRSIKLNPQWVAMESRNQQVMSNAASQAQRAEHYRNEQALATQRYCNQVDQEIAENRMKMNSEINNDNYLMLTGQEDYRNPYTNEVETRENLGKHRWVDSSGNAIYTDDPNYNPNYDPRSTRSDYQYSPVRKRFGE